MSGSPWAPLDIVSPRIANDRQCHDISSAETLRLAILSGWRQQLFTTTNRQICRCLAGRTLAAASVLKNSLYAHAEAAVFGKSESPDEPGTVRLHCRRHRNGTSARSQR